MENEFYCIMHQGEIVDSKIFTSYETTRNYLMWRYPKKKFFEIERNIFWCKAYGSRFKIVELTLYKN